MARSPPAVPAGRCGCAKSRRCGGPPTAGATLPSRTIRTPAQSKRVEKVMDDPAGISSSAAAIGSGSQLRCREEPAAETGNPVGLHRFVIIRTFAVAHFPMSYSSSPAPVTDRTASSILDLIGRTPLVRLPRFERETPGVELYAKAEWQNPGGSVKDRAAARMIADGEASGRLRPGLTIVDATSGNTGIAYAMVGAARGYKVKLFLPENASPERKLILRAFGAELVLTSPLEGTDGAIREVRRTGRRGSRSLFLSGSVQQRRQLARPLRRHRPGDHRADQRPDHPLRRRARHQRHLHGDRPGPAPVQPVDQADLVRARFAVPRPRGAEAHGDGDGAGDLRRRRSPTRSSSVSTEDAHRLVRRLARDEGLLVGISAGAALGVTLQVARRLSERRRGDGVSGRRGEIPERDVLDGRRVMTRQALQLDAGVADVIRRHGEETLPHECCGALIGLAAGRVGDGWAHGTSAGDGRGAAAEHHRRGSAAPVPGPARPTTASPSSGRASSAANCSGSITRTPIIRRGRRSSTSITRGRRSRT